MKRLRYLFFISPILWISCNDSEDSNPLLPSDFVNGVFITNEGNFGEGDGSLSYYDRKEDKVYNNIFSVANADKNLGDVVQSIALSMGRAFVVVNNSNKVEVMNADNMEIDYTITDVKLPRYLVAKESKGYVSEWVSFTEVGRISIFDMMTGDIQKRITTDYGAEGLLISGDRLFVSNNFSKTLSVIDLISESVVKTMEVGSSPGLMEFDADGDIWLICGGGYDLDYNPLGDGKLVEIDPETLEVKTEIDLGMNVPAKISTNPERGILYYFSGTSLYAFDISDTAAPTTPMLTNEGAVSFYGIGVDVTGMIYLSDSKGFTENGEVFVYDGSGTLTNNFQVGRGPNGFLFQ